MEFIYSIFTLLVLREAWRMREADNIYFIMLEPQGEQIYTD
jgi:hypothetical protein